MKIEKHVVKKRDRKRNSSQYTSEVPDALQHFIDPLVEHQLAKLLEDELKEFNGKSSN